MTIPTSYYRTIRRNQSIVGYWRMNDSGTVATDWAGKYDLNGSYNGTVVNGISLINNDFTASSKLFAAVANSNLEIPYSSPLDLTENFTIEAWVTVNAENQTGAIFGKNYILEPTIDSAAPYYLGLKEGKIRFELGQGTEKTGHKGKFLTSPTVVPIGIPVHIVVTFYNKEYTEIMINGIKVANSTRGEVIPENNEFPIYIGNSFKGNIGEVALYSSALSENIIKEHFAIGRQVIYKKQFYPQYNIPSYS